MPAAVAPRCAATPRQRAASFADGHKTSAPAREYALRQHAQAPVAAPLGARRQSPLRETITAPLRAGGRRTRVRQDVGGKRSAPLPARVETGAVSCYRRRTLADGGAQGAPRRPMAYTSTRRTARPRPVRMDPPTESDRLVLRRGAGVGRADGARHRQLCAEYRSVTRAGCNGGRGERSRTPLAAAGATRGRTRGAVRARRPRRILTTDAGARSSALAERDRDEARPPAHSVERWDVEDSTLSPTPHDPPRQRGRHRASLCAATSQASPVGGVPKG